MSSKTAVLAFPHRDLFIRLFGDRVFLVGGVVRDYVMNGSIDDTKDIDLIVVDSTYDQIEKKLKRFGKTHTVGKSFAVVKFTIAEQTFDIAIPRRDRKLSLASHSHKNFIVDAGPHVSLEDDLSRRDFTCNSMALRLSDGKRIDPFSGASAIRKKKIVMTNPESFPDDPLRVFRAARFASVLRFSLDPAIYDHAREVCLDQLSIERVSEELIRLLLESPRPSVGMDNYLRLTVLEKWFPELYAESLTIQDSRFHPEKDSQGHHTVWAHTLISIDVAKEVAGAFSLDEERTLALLLAALLHDVGKTETTRWEYKRGRMTVTSALHDSRGMRLAIGILDRLKIESRKRFPLRKVVLLLIQNHHRLFDLYRNRREIGFKAIARLVKDMEGEDLLLMLLDYTDRQSRKRNARSHAALDAISRWYQKQKEKFRISRESIRPLLQGRDLIPLGVSPGPAMGKYLQEIFDLQLEGRFATKEGGLRLFRRLHPVGERK